ncbi:MAG TPA: hypothetical protein VJ787_14390 [Thermoleophilia bacterium]|nr:hypothetical protein [Thermoleophilia bacterium]
MRRRGRPNSLVRRRAAMAVTLAAAVASCLVLAAAVGGAARAATAPDATIQTPQHSTTGPTPPPSVKLAASGAQSAAGAAAGEVVIPGVPAYLWRDGCGPTAVGMVLGYYDAQGWGDLIPGDATAQTAAVSQAIASHDPGSGARHYEDYVLPDDSDVYPDPPLLDMSSIDPYGAHLSDSVADFMRTSWSVDGVYYGWSYSNMIGPAFEGFVVSAAPQYAPTTADYYMGSTLTWTLVKGEIDTARPLVFLVDSSGDGYTDHFVTVIGYRETYGYPEYACWDTWSATNVRWQRFRAMSSSYSWGVWGATTFHVAAPVTLTAPNGGEDWTSGEVHNIAWTAGIGHVTLEVSCDGGPYSTIAAATPNDGSYDWTVTGPASGQVRLRVTALAFSGSDVSDAPFTITVPPDTDAPVTTVAGADSLWHRLPVTLAFTATDTGSGVLRTEYAIDGADWQTGDQAVVSSQGVHSVAYRSVDNALNVEASQTRTVKYDALGPQTTAYATSVYRGRAVTLRYRVADLTPKATVTLRVKTLSGVTRKTISLGTRWTGRTLGYRFTCNLARGTYRYHVYARDQAGNTQGRLGSATLRVL